MYNKMNININNYQEFLLSYIDKELSIDEAQAVEQFVANNSFAQAELKLLLSTKLQPTQEVFDNSNSLYKHQHNEISINNYEEKFAEYVDGELTATEQKQVETFVLQHPNLQNEFTIFKQTKLFNTLLQYPNKKELYRQERGKVWSIARWAVAAAFIGLSVAIWWANDTKQTETAIVNTQKNVSTIEQKTDATIIAQKNKTSNVENSDVAIIEATNATNNAKEIVTKSHQNIVVNNKVVNGNRDNANAVTINNNTTNTATKPATTVELPKTIVEPIKPNENAVNNTSIAVTKPQEVTTQNITIANKPETIDNTAIANVSTTTKSTTQNTTTEKKKGVFGLLKKAVGLINKEETDEEDRAVILTIR